MILGTEQTTKYAEYFADLYNVGANKLDQLNELMNYSTCMNVAENLDVLDKKGDKSNLTPQFKKDLAISKVAEEILVEAYHCHNYNNSAIYSLNDDNRFDIKIEYTQENGVKRYAYIEVKNDMSAIKYGNIAIEFESWNKPSGIVTTQSNIWAQRVDGFYLIFNTNKLKQCVQEKVFRTVYSGESKGSKSYLLKIKDILSYVDHIIIDETFYR